MRRQAEKQQPVYRLILLCAPNLDAASCEAPPRSFSSVSAPHTPHPAPLCLTFLAAESCMGAFPEQKQICLVLRHFLSLDPCLFFFFQSCLKAAQRGYSEKRNVLTLLFMFCYTLLCISLALCVACPFLSSLANSQYDGDKRNFLSFLDFKGLPGLFLMFLRVARLYLFWDGARSYTFLGSCVEPRGHSIVHSGQEERNSLTITEVSVVDVPEI